MIATVRRGSLDIQICGPKVVERVNGLPYLCEDGAFMRGYSRRPMLPKIIACALIATKIWRNEAEPAEVDPLSQ
jgi:hypothetical protein